MPTSPEHAPRSGGSSDAFSFAAVAAQAGSCSSAGARYAIVVARFNAGITDNLYAGAVQTLLDAGAPASHVRGFSVPGAIEIPFAARELALTSHYAGIIALGCVIQGGTAHFEYVCRSVTDGCSRVALDTGVPIGFGVLTCDTLEQAEKRSLLTPGGHNVGADAASAAIEMAGLARVVRGS